jgi:hypothetical protein
MIFFSMTSWKSGGGGKSIARSRNGDRVDLMSNDRFLTKH